MTPLDKQGRLDHSNHEHDSFYYLQLKNELQQEQNQALCDFLMQRGTLF